MRAYRGIAIVVCLLLSAALTGVGQSREAFDVEQRLVTFAGRLRLSLSLASFAVYAPSLEDLRLHAQQVINLLEGSEGAHFVQMEEDGETLGLRRGAAELGERLYEVDLEPSAKSRLTSALRNVTVYLDLALDATLSGLKARRLDEAVEQLMKSYAYLSAAYARPGDTAELPGLWTLLRQFQLIEIDVSRG